MQQAEVIRMSEVQVFQKEKGWCFYRGWATSSSLDGVERALSKLAKAPKEPEDQREIYKATARLAMSHAVDAITSGRKLYEDSCIKITENELSSFREKFNETVNKEQLDKAKDLLNELGQKVLRGLSDTTGFSF